ncbi:Eukaryotic translation initiation factor 3 subunit I [Aphelenchoides bicaudatus]|nr:Eukaryotic translation initiation factor 3 subunit I [Aphelenchoides bicaudatus]
MKPLSLQGHTRALTRVRINEDGDLLFTSAKDHSPCVWYLENGERLGSYEAHTGVIWDIDVSFDTKTMVSCSGDQSVKVWDVETGVDVATRKANAVARSISQSYSGNLVAYTTTMGVMTKAMLFIIDIRDRDQVNGDRFAGKTGLDTSSHCCVFSHLDDTITVGGKQNLYKYDLRQLADATNFEVAHGHTIQDLQLSPDQGLLISASSDRTAKLHNAHNLELLKTYSHGRPVNSAAISPTHDYIVLGGGEDAMNVTQTVAASGQFEAKLYDMIYEDEFAMFKGHFGPINTLAYSPDGCTIVTGSEDGFVRIQEIDQEYFDYEREELPDGCLNFFTIYWPKINSGEEEIESGTMFESSSGNQYRRLNRGGNGFTRNVTFFAILVGLVVVFSVFYLYTSASNDASALRFEVSSQSDYITKLKNEVLGLNTKLEELKNSDTTCKESKLTLSQQSEECSTNLKQANEQLQTATSEKTKLNTELEALRAKNTELSSTLEAQKVNMSAMQNVGVGQEAIVIKLNETIDALRRDLILKMRSSKNWKMAKPVALPNILQRPVGTTTKSAVIAPPAAADNQAPDGLAMPNKVRQIGDRVKLEEANQNKGNDGTLLDAAAKQQNADVGAIDSPVLTQSDDAKSGEV